VRRFYRSGEAIAGFRGIRPEDPFTPEDFVASTTNVDGSGLGLSRLEDGRTLKEHIATNPEAFLGPEHVQRFGADPALLVKLLNTGERLLVHAHPDRGFARTNLGSPYGKTEAWVIVEVEGESGTIHLGFAEDVSRETLAGWVAEQDAERLLGAMNEIVVRPGDTYFVPAGLPHAIGEGIFLVEPQEPTDFSVFLEWEGFAVDGTAEGHLGLGFDAALGAIDRSGWDERRLSRLRLKRGEVADRPGVERLFPVDADPYFRAERIRPRPSADLDAAFSVLVVLNGEGQLETEGGNLALARGTTVMVPYAAGPGSCTGSVEILRCLPPEPMMRREGS